LKRTKESFGDLVFKDYIPACIDFKYVENLNTTIFTPKYNKSAGAKAYRAVVRELIDELGLK
jgi:cellulose biosynthesis protein BcsQ